MRENEQKDFDSIKIVTRKIKPHGSFFPQAADGTVINPASMDNVPESVYPLIDEVVTAYQQRFEQNLHSVYVRGSVVHGTSVRNFSDLDTFALVQPTDKQQFIWWCTPDWESEASSMILSEYPGYITKIDFGYATWHEDFLRRNPTLATTIKTQSLCIAGTNVQSLLPGFKPGLEMCCNYLGLERELALLSAMVLGQKNLDVYKAQAAVKRMIRVGFELIMEQEGRYTGSLYYCCDCLCRYYPEKRETVRQLLEFYLNPQPDLEAIAKCLTYGKWLKEKVDRDLRPRIEDLASAEQ